MNKKVEAEKAAVPAVTDQKSALPAFMADRAAQDAGKGVSTDREDNQVPLIYVLQALSPQCNKRNNAYVEGAEPGSIWLRNSPDPIVPGDGGLLFQPCAFQKDWVEWVPRDNGGGFVGRHDTLPADAKEVADPKNPNKVRYVLPSGNEVIETRYHVGFVIREGHTPMPYVIPLSSSGHTVSRQWMFMMNSKMLGADKKAPSWACYYRLKTKERSNKRGETWFTFDVSDAGWVPTLHDYERGAALYEAFASGERTIAEEEHVGSEPVGDNAAM